MGIGIVCHRRTLLDAIAGARPRARRDRGGAGGRVLRRQSGQRFDHAFHNRCRKSVEPIRPIEWQRRDAIQNLIDKLLFH
jgi:hypothetical protein